MKNILPASLLLLLFSQRLSAQVYGCTDPLASNFNASATTNDGSCIYPAANITPSTSVNLSAAIPESSGLVFWNQQLWTHNDNADTNLYVIDTLSGYISQQAPLPAVDNIDWEELTQDSAYLYIGDFGNNANGNRTNLNILRIEKNSVASVAPVIDTIHFAYADQTVFTPTGGNNTDFDCEAFVVTTDSIYLFTKQWIGNQTVCYALPKTPGTHTAQPRDTLNVAGLITGATLRENERIIVLVGYSALIQPFVYLLYDFTAADFFGANKRKLNVTLPFHQAEGIASASGTRYYVSNEHFSQPPIINVTQQLHLFDLGAYLGDYIDSLTTGMGETIEVDGLAIYPNPVQDIVTVESGTFPFNYRLVNSMGETVIEGTLTKDLPGFSVARLPAGIYFLHETESGNAVRIVVGK